MAVLSLYLLQLFTFRMNNISILTTKLYNETPDNVHGVGYGFKEKNGQVTNNLSIIFNVIEKKPLSAIAQNEILPSAVTSDEGVVYITDVVETPQMSAHYCYPDDPAQLPVSLHMAPRTPYTGGICISWPIPGQPGTASTGTMGCLCVDTTDDTIVALTNAHVGIPEPRSAAYPGAPATFNNTQWINYQALPWSFLSVLSLKRYIPFTNTSNTIDAAVLAVTGTNLIDTLSSFKQLNLNYNQNLQFASTGEINSLVVGGVPAGNPIFKGGRRTGPVGWPGSAPWGSEFCSVTATQLFYATGVNFGTYTVPFSDTIIYRSNNIKASDSGDSGSAVCALYNQNSPSLSAWKVVGLNFAGGGEVPNAVALACRIDNICQSLQLTAWNGQPIALTNFNNQDIQYIAGKSNNPFVDINGKRYWQVGTTN
jgi:hypothetical protein